MGLRTNSGKSPRVARRGRRRRLRPCNNERKHVGRYAKEALMMMTEAGGC